MPNQFHSQINSALADPALQAALDGNAERRQQAFRQAYASLPEDFKVMRRRAHAVRQKTISDLDHYLEIFTANAQANGMIVHQASDAAQAVKIVLQIAQERFKKNEGKPLVTKSKSMVSEEIHLNQALEAQGIKVVETDLGEYIIQLRNEPPAHIITPAVHLDREQVGKTFHQKLGIPLTTDIPTLTSAARKVLRDAFLNSAIGISGVNFGVAENGAICVLTNEGNGRMITTLPDIHIALMGIERLVPNLQDLALMLYLLPRSATGQKLTVYANLIYGPRRQEEDDGPTQRHLILIDNGRRALQNSTLSEALYCIRCGACLNACPVFREIGGHAYVGSQGQGSPYPGPIGSVVSPGLFGLSEFGHLARASSLCGACQEACPVDINLPKNLLRVRSSAKDPISTDRSITVPGASVPVSLQVGLQLFTWAATSAGRFRAAQRFVGWASRLLVPHSDWLHLPAFSGWGFSRDLPRPANRPFRDRFAELVFEPENTTNKPLPNEKRINDQKNHLTISTQTPVERFAAELTALEGKFILCPQGDLNEQLLVLINKHHIRRIQAWDEGVLPEGVLDALQDEGVDICRNPDPSIRAGLTGAHAGIAETGTLVISAGAGRPLTASLLPEIHIALLRASDIVPSLPQALQDKRLQDLVNARLGSSFVLISGPSRTADIEMTLTIGVHGPSEVYVICLSDI